MEEFNNERSLIKLSIYQDFYRKEKTMRMYLYDIIPKIQTREDFVIYRFWFEFSQEFDKNTDLMSMSEVMLQDIVIFNKLDTLNEIIAISQYKFEFVRDIINGALILGRIEILEILLETYKGCNHLEIEEAIVHRQIDTTIWWHKICQVKSIEFKYTSETINRLIISQFMTFTMSPYIRHLVGSGKVNSIKDTLNCLLDLGETFSQIREYIECACKFNNIDALNWFWEKSGQGLLYEASINTNIGVLNFLRDKQLNHNLIFIYNEILLHNVYNHFITFRFRLSDIELINSDAENQYVNSQWKVRNEISSEDEENQQSYSYKEYHLMQYKRFMRVLYWWKKSGLELKFDNLDHGDLGNNLDSYGFDDLTQFFASDI